jgi:hypothetical protein
MGQDDVECELQQFGETIGRVSFKSFGMSFGQLTLFKSTSPSTVNNLCTKDPEIGVLDEATKKKAEE